MAKPKKITKGYLENIRASLEDQKLDVRIGITTQAEWDRRRDAYLDLVQQFNSKGV